MKSLLTVTFTLVLSLGLWTPSVEAQPQSTASGESSMEDTCKQEVLDLHQFFQDWFRGELPKTDQAFERFSGVMDDSFHIVSPGGHMTPIGPLSQGLKGAHGSWSSGSTESQGFRIWIENMRFRRLSDDTALVTYEEWQEKGGPAKGRISTAIFERDAEAPNGVRWLHVHETWLPTE